MGCGIGIVLYSILQFIAFVFMVVGTPLEMFRGKTVDKVKTVGCVTMWGYKEKCHKTKYTTKVGKLFPGCSGRKDRFRAAEAFAIINIVIYGVACLLGFVMLCCCHCLRWVCLVLNIFGITSVVSWAIMVNAYTSSSGKNPLPVSTDYCYKFKHFYKYGAGFALLLTGWCLDIVDIVFLMLPC